jgi:hypothetical protein
LVTLNGQGVQIAFTSKGDIGCLLRLKTLGSALDPSRSKTATPSHPRPGGCSTLLHTSRPIRCTTRRPIDGSLCGIGAHTGSEVLNTLHLERIKLTFLSLKRLTPLSQGIGGAFDSGVLLCIVL